MKYPTIVPRGGLLSPTDNYESHTYYPNSTILMSFSDIIIWGVKKFSYYDFLKLISFSNYTIT